MDHRRKLTLFVVAMIVGLFCCERAQAASVVSQWFLGEENKISDNSGEYLFNRVLGPGGSTTTLEVGDVLITGFSVGTVEDLTGSGGTNSFGAGGVNFFSGLAAIEVTSVVTAGPTSFFTFAPLSPAAKADLLAGVDFGPAGPSAGDTAPSPVVGAQVGSWATGTMIALYDDPTNDFVRVPTPGAGDDGGPYPGDVGDGPFASEETMLLAAINGTRILEVGFDANAATLDFWSASVGGGLVDIALAGGVTTSTNIGTVNFGLNLTAPPSGAASGINFGLLPSFDPALSLPGVSQFPGNANIQGLLTSQGIANTPFDIFDDLNASFAPSSVPEPSTMILGAIGLGFAVGLAAVKRSRRKRLSSRA